MSGRYDAAASKTPYAGRSTQLQCPQFTQRDVKNMLDGFYREINKADWDADSTYKGIEIISMPKNRVSRDVKLVVMNTPERIKKINPKYSAV